MRKNIYVGIVILVAFGFGVMVGTRSNYQDVDSPSAVESADKSPSADPVSIPRKNAPVFALGIDANLQTSNAAPEGVAETFSTGDLTPTPVELAAMAELQRREAAGEYILDRDNPFIVRMQERSLERRLKMMVPAIAAIRQDILSHLGVDADTVAKFTNHAARVVEASTLMGQTLYDLKKAKMEYDNKARALLTPEQYAQFKEFEVRQAIGKELEQFQVSGMENLSHGDLTGISQSIADLGIQDDYSTYLPYERDPSTYVLGGDAVKDFKVSKIAKLELAAQDLDRIAERNHLSEEARQLMASMIEHRTQQVQMELEQLPILEQQHRSQLRSMVPPNLPPPPDP